jgi:HEAT repeat protein
MGRMTDAQSALSAALSDEEPSARLQSALAAGTHPRDAYLEPLVDRCAVEPDFYVRDMLTWALTRLPVELVLPRVIGELASPTPQARSQALHTLSKLRDGRAWSAIRRDHLHDTDDEVARTAWRAAAGLVPHDRRAALARELALELGRGYLEVMRSLSRAFVELDEAAVPVLERHSDGDSPGSRHARATLRLIEDPGATFTLE